VTGLWAVSSQAWIGMPRKDADCPRTEWMHEGRAPYRVLVSADPAELPALQGTVRLPYTGGEATIAWDVYVQESIDESTA
jgi:hypothetical protein